MKYTKRNIQKLIGLSIRDAKIKALNWFNMSCTVRGYNLFYPAIAVNDIILFVLDEKDLNDEEAMVFLAGAGDPTKLE